MTKWGMPGVYTHAFMDGWSPGYLGSVAYNHNGMMRMYETQSGRDVPAPAAGRARRRRRGAGCRARRRDAATGAVRGAAPAARAGGAAARGAAAPGRRAVAGPAAGRAAGPPTGRGGGQPREWYRGIPIPPGAANNFSRRNNTNYMQTGVLSALQLTAMFPNLIVDNFYRKTKNSIESGKTEAPYGFVIPVQRDMTRVAELVNILRVQRIEIGQATGEIKIGDGDVPGRLLRHQARSAVRPPREEPARAPELSRIPNLRTYDDSGWTMGLAMLVDVKEIKDKAILDVTTTPVDEAVASRARSPAAGTRRPRGRALRLEQHDRVPLRAAERADEDRREELHRRRRRVPGRLVRDRAARGSARPRAPRSSSSGSPPPRCRRCRRSRCTTPTCRASRCTRRGTARRRSAGCGSRSTSSASRTT